MVELSYAERARAHFKAIEEIGSEPENFSDKIIFGFSCLIIVTATFEMVYAFFIMSKFVFDVITHQIYF
jgi:hypothetical protein